MGGFSFPGIDAAIAKFEGYGTPGVPATVNNNPGNLICGNFASNAGAIGCSTNSNGYSFAVFPDPNTGALAEDQLVQSYSNKGATLQDLINAWAPPTAPGNSAVGTQNYINTIANQLGASPNTLISSLQGVSLPTTSNTQQPGTTVGLPSFGKSMIGGIIGSLFGPIGTAVGGSTGTLFGIPIGRIGAFIGGLILIAGGIYLFKPVQTVVSGAVRTGAKIAAV